MTGIDWETTANQPVPIRTPDRFFIGGEWVAPRDGLAAQVTRPDTEEPLYSVAVATKAEMSAAVAAAREAFDDGPWSRISVAERADYLRAIAAGLRERSADLAWLWAAEVGILHSVARRETAHMADVFDEYAELSTAFGFVEERATKLRGKRAVLAHEPVGVVGAILAWNGPSISIAYKVAPAILAGCTVVLKSAPEAPGEALVLAEVAEEVGLPAGVLNVVTADRDVSELLVRDARVDKISFTGSTAAGRRIAALCAERIARVSLELGGKSAALILDDYDLERAASTLARAQCYISGQVCAALTRVVISRHRRDDFLEAMRSAQAEVRVGSQFDPASTMGPLATNVQRARVERYIATGLRQGATLVTGGGRPRHLSRGYFVEPTTFAAVEPHSSIAQEEIFGPVLAVIDCDDERNAIRIANDSIYGLNAAVFTHDEDRALGVARALRSGSVGHNGPFVDYSIGFGGFKQSGVGREGGVQGLLPYLESKTIVLSGNSTPDRRIGS
ncbi:aldehyde dehydrogenase [uncultured Jatrophihabitans sp.]|uniref:aldehyde dehydrogenase n=1 Tax=uncultured Jatrophihabitans sp. TaxID=1610747 RepID=UPI0035CC39F8